MNTLHTSNGNNVAGKVFENRMRSNRVASVKPYSTGGGCALVLVLAVIAVVIFAVIIPAIM